MKIAVIGVGRIGANHARICTKLRNADLIGYCDIIKEKADNLARQFNTKSFYDYKEMIKYVDAVIIATQTVYHYEIAKYCIENNKHVLIEKPITINDYEARELIELSKSHNVVLTVGHVERFNSAVQALSEIFDPNKTISLSIKRMSPMDHRVKDIDVVLDLMVHDIDVMLHLMKGHEVVDISAMGSIMRNESIESRHCDYAVAHIKFDNGVIADLTASRVTEKKIRTLSVNTLDQFIELDYMNKTVIQYGNFESHLNHIPNDNRVKYLQRAIVQEVFVNNSESLLDEDQNFVDAINGIDDLKVTSLDALDALEISNKIREKIYK